MRIKTIHDNKPTLRKYDPANPPDVASLQFLQTYYRKDYENNGQYTEHHLSNGFYAIAWFDGSMSKTGALFVYNADGLFPIRPIHAFENPDATPERYLTIQLPNAIACEDNLPLNSTDPRYHLLIKSLLGIENIIETQCHKHILSTTLKLAIQNQLVNFNRNN